MKSRRQSFICIVSLGILNALTPFSIDLYLPAFSKIAEDLKTSIPRVSLSVSVYFIGYALGQIFYGPLLDRFGRKRPLYMGLGIYILASLGCMTAKSVESLIVFRFISSLGGSAGSVGATTMVQDLFPRKDAAKVFSMLMLVLSVSPLLAPTAGSLVVGILGWRSLFGILTGIAVLDILLIAFVIPGDYLPDREIKMRPKAILKNFQNILKIPRFWVYTLSGSLSFAGLFVYVAGSPVLFLEEFGVSPGAFGGIFAFLACSMIGGGQLNHLLIKRYGSKTTFKMFLITQSVVSLFFLASCTVTSSLVSTIAFLFILLGCGGITYPNAASLALEPFTKNIGSASALLGFSQLGLGSFAATLVSFLNMKGSLPLAIVMSICPWVGLIILLVQREPD